MQVFRAQVKQPVEMLTSHKGSMIAAKVVVYDSQMVYAVGCERCDGRVKVRILAWALRS
jgi:hypothetical protein